MSTVAAVLDVLETHYGVQTASWPTDPYLFLVWWHCGYPASDAACARGWASLTSHMGTDPKSLLQADPFELAALLKPGGMVPELRAMRLKEIARKAQDVFEGDLPGAIKTLPLAEARAALRSFPNIGNPGADRILLFAGISPVAAVPSNCPHVLVRLLNGDPGKDYSKTYKKAQDAIAADIAASFEDRMRAYLLLKRHGQQVCRTANPKCGECPVAAQCRFFSRL